MKIVSFRIENFKNLSFAESNEVDDLMVLAGPNGVGKSSVLEALVFWKEAMFGSRNAQFLQSQNYMKFIRRGSKSAAITVALKVEKDEIEYWNDIHFNANGNAQTFYNQLNEDNLMAPIEMNTEEAISANEVVECKVNILSNGNLSIEGEKFNILRMIMKYPDRSKYPKVGIFDYYGPNRFLPARDFFSFNAQSLSWNQEKNNRILPQTQIEQKGNILKDYLYALFHKEIQWFQDQSAFKNKSGTIDIGEMPYAFEGINNILKKLLPHLTFSRVFIPHEMGGTIEFLFKVNNEIEVELDQLSSGEKAILYLFFELERMNLCNSIIFLDEPEVHVHQSAQANILPFLKDFTGKNNNQVFVVSHSTAILSSADEGDLYRVDSFKNEKSNQLVQIKSKQARAGVLKSLVGTLGTYTASDTFVFLEGERGDKSFDKGILEILFPELKKKLTFIPCENCSVVNDVSEKIMEILNEDIPFGKFFGIRDRDRLDDAEIQKLKESTPNLNIWPYYSIENFLMDPAVWMIAVNWFKTEKTAISEKDVSAIFLEIGIGMKESEIDLRRSQYLLKKMTKKDFRNSRGCSVEKKLEDLSRQSLALKDELADITEKFTKEVESELANGDFLKYFRGHDLIKSAKNKFSLSLPDVELGNFLAKTMQKENKIPFTLSEIINNISS
ncbi:MAG: AAA family ATPase [Selenomonadaceae bacterium]